ncbi:MAG: glycosyltransferase [Bacteroides sp.]|nr:glycosyltransferase [Bacteroides sp.]
MHNALKQPKVSVIVPLYNTEEYVHAAVSSVMNQTLPEIEIIVINDGSTDNSLDIVNKLAEEDRRIRIFSQTNQGLSITRNQGVLHATGEYLYFMDSDDIIDETTLAACYERCLSHQLDFVFFNAEVLNKESKWASLLHYERDPEKIRENQVYTGSEALRIQLDSNSYYSSACLSVIRTDFFRRHRLGFYPHIVHEDELFTALLYLHADRTGFINQTFFKRRFRDDSIMTSKFAQKNMQGYFTVADNLLDFRTSQTKDNQQLIDLFLRRMLNAAVWKAWVMPFGERADILKKCLTRYKKYVSARTVATVLFKPIKAAIT